MDERSDGPGAGAAGGADRVGRMRLRIEQRFMPVALEIVDESALHAGHAGVAASRSAGSGETHFAMLVVSGSFAGTSRVQRSRLVHEVLAAEFAQGLHALSLTLRTPEEHLARL